MKKVLLFMLMCVLSLHAYSQSKDYYYQHGGLLYHLSFYTDKENDYVADAFCLNMFYKFGYKGKDSRGQLRFQSFTYVAEQKMVQTFYSPLPIPQMTGRVIKSYTSNNMLISSDYSTMILNGMGYVRISKEKYQKIVNGISSALITLQVHIPLKIIAVLNMAQRTGRHINQNGKLALIVVLLATVKFVMDMENPYTMPIIRVMVNSFQNVSIVVVLKYVQPVMDVKESE